MMGLDLFGFLEAWVLWAGVAAIFVCVILAAIWDDGEP